MNPVGKAIDYAGRPPDDFGHLLRDHGIQAALRYVGQPNNPKCLRANELRTLLANGIALGFIYETTATWMLQGGQAGARAAVVARNHIEAMGGPAAPTVYFTADFDANGFQISQVAETLAGAASVLGADHVGIYGGYYVVHSVLAAGHARYGWQTWAWSYGQWEPRAQVRQIGGQSWGNLGIGYDADELLAVDWGQWPAAKPAPAVTRLLYVPADPYQHRALWAASWPLRKAWLAAPHQPQPRMTVALRVPIAVYNHREQWVAGWRSRTRWAV